MTSQFTDDTGYGFGFFADWEVDAGRTVRLAYDGLFYPSRKDSSPIAGMASPSVRSTISDRKPRTDSLTLQYLFFPSRDIEGFYLMAGLGAMKYQQKIDASVQLADASILTPTFLQTSGTRLACVAGAGYEFGKQWGVSGKYSFITVNNHTLGGVQAGLSYRF
jgi:hypothetical protein